MERANQYGGEKEGKPPGITGADTTKAIYGKAGTPGWRQESRRSAWLAKKKAKAAAKGRWAARRRRGRNGTWPGAEAVLGRSGAGPRPRRPDTLAIRRPRPRRLQAQLRLPGVLFPFVHFLKGLRPDRVEEPAIRF